MRKPTPLIFGMCILGTLGCSSEPPPLPRFHVELVPRLPGYKGRRIEVEGHTIAVRETSAKGNPLDVVWEGELKDGQVRVLRQALRAVPVEDLAWKYWYPVWDGADYVFMLPDPNGKMRETRLHYVRRAKLIQLAEALDSVLPEEHRLHCKKAIHLATPYYDEHRVQVTEEPPKSRIDNE